MFAQNITNNKNSFLQLTNLMRILGIDPGTLVTGYGVVNCSGNKITLVECGVVQMSGKLPMELRLKKVFQSLQKVITRTKPQLCAIESAFYHKNVQSTLKIGYARGVAMLAAAVNNLEVNEYSPRSIKQTVTGSGAASKEQVEFMVLKILALQEKQNEFLDATDALAVAICHNLTLSKTIKPDMFAKKTKAKKGRAAWSEFLEKNKSIIKQ